MNESKLNLGYILQSVILTEQQQKETSLTNFQLYFGTCHFVAMYKRSEDQDIIYPSCKSKQPHIDHSTWFAFEPVTKRNNVRIRTIQASCNKKKRKYRQCIHCGLYIIQIFKY